jgi:hypothetical protein
MRFAGYVIGGWALTGVVLLAYSLRLWQRLRRAERLDREA